MTERRARVGSFSVLTKRRVWRCSECGHAYGSDGPAEYHPYAFCVLVKAGLNPLTVVLDAVRELKLASSPAAVTGEDQ